MAVGWQVAAAGVSLVVDLFSGAPSRFCLPEAMIGGGWRLTATSG
jgi:hypothetical protein